jgi:hypothetical protein
VLKIPRDCPNMKSNARLGLRSRKTGTVRNDG